MFAPMTDSSPRPRSARARIVANAIAGSARPARQMRSSPPDGSRPVPPPADGASHSAYTGLLEIAGTHGKRHRSPPPTRLSLLAQWTSPDTIGADELFWRGVLDPRDRALDQALVGQPRLVFGADGSIGIEKDPAATAAAY
jgi:hypothetical protein